MITGSRAFFVARCQQRGYTLDDVRPCIVNEDGDTITVDERHPAYPRERTLSLIQKAANFAKSAVTHVAAGAPMASEDDVAARHAICVACEHFDGAACIKCGCPVVRERKWLSKLSWARESCPVGKWGPVG
jgi:hypothetical protein